MRAEAGSYFPMKRHDRRPSLRMAVTQKSDGTPLDLSTATAKFLMYDSSSGTQIVSAVAVIESPGTNGILRYDWQAVDTASEGEFKAEFEVDYGAGDKITLPNNGYIMVRIYADLDNL